MVAQEPLATGCERRWSAGTSRRSRHHSALKPPVCPSHLEPRPGGTTPILQQLLSVERLGGVVVCWELHTDWFEPVSVLSRVFGVRPLRAHAVRVQRDLVIPASDGVPLLANRFYPADIDRSPLVLLRSPYGRGVALDRLPHLLAERGYQVLYVSLRGTDGSGGEFDGFTIDPADGDGTLSWLR
jgi:predicted acyl esterase